MKKISKERYNQLADLLPPMPLIAGLELEVFMEKGPVDNTIVVAAINSLGQTFIDATSEVALWRKLNKEVPVLEAGPDGEVMLVLLSWLIAEYPKEEWLKELDATLRKRTKFNL